MPRHHPGGGRVSAASSSAAGGNGGALTPAAISTLLPPALQFISPPPAPQSPPRRRLPRHIPVVDPVSGTRPAGTASKQRPSAAPAKDPLDSPSNSSILQPDLGGFGAKVSGPSLPVVRAGATFLSTLSTSVALSASLHPPSNPASAPPSPCLVPIGSRTSHSASSTLNPTSLAAPAASTRPNDAKLLLAASMSSDNDKATAAGPTPLPSLDFVPATDEDERTAGLKLVADSMAQRRQLASYAIMTHPFFLGMMGLAFSGVYSYLYRTPGDAALVFTTCVGVLMAGLVSIRSAVRPYLDLAEGINFAWLADGDVVVARWGDGEDRKVIGALVYIIEKKTSDGGSSSAKGSKKARKVALVRAWTTRQRERGKGVGKGLVEETVKLVKARGVDDVRWQDGNIYETRVLPKWANSGFEEGLKACRLKLEEYITEYSGR